MIPIVTLAGSPTRASVNVGCDNDSGMRALVNHLTVDHGYRHLAYLSGHADSPDNRARARVFEAAATAVGAEIQTGPAWQGNYSAAGGAQVIASLLDRGGDLPRAIVCANDQTALGVIHALARRGDPRTRRRRRHRLRRRPGGTPSPPVADHHPPAHRADGGHGVRRPLFEDQRERRRVRRRPAGSTRAPRELRLRSGCRRSRPRLGSGASHAGARFAGWASTSSPPGLRSRSASCCRGWCPATRSPAPSHGLSRQASATRFASRPSRRSWASTSTRASGCSTCSTWAISCTGTSASRGRRTRR